MFQRDAARFVRIGIIIQSFYSNIVADTLPGSLVTDEQKAHLLEGLSGIRSDCGEMGLVRTQAVLDSIIHDYEGSVGQTQAHLKRSIEHIDATFSAELQEHVFVQIDPARLAYMMTREDFARNPIFGHGVASSFRSAMEDTREAGLCFAVHRHTACVFHCMRVLERGLHALARALQVPFSIPFEYQQWNAIIVGIDSAIKKLEQQPAGQTKTETLEFYSQAALQFFYFKDAWRNHVSHSRTSYDGEQAKMVLEHVEAFMRCLADGGLHE